MQMEEALDRCEFAIRHQQDEIARLRAELERRNEELTQLLAWINGDSDALVVLQRTYMDPRTSTSDRIKACAAAAARAKGAVSSEIYAAHKGNLDCRGVHLFRQSFCTRIGLTGNRGASAVRPSALVRNHHDVP